MKISELVSDLSYKEIKERKWKRCRIFRNGEEIVFLEFAVSDKGEVMRILPPKIRCKKSYLGRMCKLDDRWDYIFTNFRKDERNYRVRIHKLVMESFVGRCPEGKEVNHKGGKKHYNFFKNLEYVTKGKNREHAYRLGLQPKTGVALLKGEDHPNAKLFQKEVNKIRKLWKSGKFMQKELGIKYNVSGSCISHLVNWHTYKDKVVEG